MGNAARLYCIEFRCASCQDNHSNRCTLYHILKMLPGDTNITQNDNPPLTKDMLHKSRDMLLEENTNKRLRGRHIDHGVVGGTLKLNDIDKLYLLLRLKNDNFKV